MISIEFATNSRNCAWLHGVMLFRRYACGDWLVLGRVQCAFANILYADYSRVPDGKLSAEMVMDTINGFLEDRERYRGELCDLYIDQPGGSDKIVRQVTL